MKDKCAYCDLTKIVTIWKETGEKVCYDCRLDFLDQEFNQEEKPYLSL